MFPKRQMTQVFDPLLAPEQDTNSGKVAPPSARVCEAFGILASLTVLQAPLPRGSHQSQSPSFCIVGIYEIKKIIQYCFKYHPNLKGYKILIRNYSVFSLHPCIMLPSK